jgi:hypothetical protein
LAGFLSTVVAGKCGGIATSNPGLQKFIFAPLFPVNLLLILMLGGQLFTGNSATPLPCPLPYTRASSISMASSRAAGGVKGCLP